jgi:osmotically-inducible protein OsmY
VKSAVQKRLDDRESLAGADIDVEVSKGVVRLSGTVDSYSDKMTALTVARTTDGVDSIVDSLRVEDKTGG